MAAYLAQKAAQSRAIRAEQWQLIQDKAPDVAAFIQAIAARTGKLKSIRVTFADGSTVEVNNG